MPVIPPGGVSPAGAFVEHEHDGPGSPPIILADAIDPDTGEYLSLTRGYDPVDGAVLEAFRVERRSGSATMNDGQRFRDAEHVDPKAPDFFRQEGRLALARLIDAGLVTLNRVEVAPKGDTVNASFFYWNKARGEPQKAIKRIGELL